MDVFRLWSFEEILNLPRSKRSRAIWGVHKSAFSQTNDSTNFIQFLLYIPVATTTTPNPKAPSLYRIAFLQNLTVMASNPPESASILPPS